MGMAPQFPKLCNKPSNLSSLYNVLGILEVIIINRYRYRENVLFAPENSDWLVQGACMVAVPCPLIPELHRLYREFR